MTMRLLTEEDVAKLVTPELAIAAAEAAFVEQALNAATPPQGRLDLRRESPHPSALIVAGFSATDLLAVKTNGHCWPAQGGGRVSRGLLTLWDMRSASPIALISATLFNDHRTAAGFAAAAKRLARPDAETLTVFGAGKLAAPSLRYLCHVRPIRRVFIVGRTTNRAHAMALRLMALPEFSEIELCVTSDARLAAQEADIIATTTSSNTPVFPGQAVRPGTLVILGGANRLTAREADDDLIGRATVFTDSTTAALEKAGDLAIPLASGMLAPQRIQGEIGRWINKPLPHGAKDDVIVFKSVGIAVQDIALARMLLSEAASRGIGQTFVPGCEDVMEVS